MATYVIADIHGCYEEYMELLHKIGFSEKDELYILGDCVDRGPEPIKVLQDLMNRHNVICLAGNHDLVMLLVLRPLAVELTEKSAARLQPEDFQKLLDWQMDGGDVTLEQFIALSKDEQENILSFVEDFSIYEDISINGKRYILAHGGIENFSPDKSLDEYDITDFVFARAVYTKRYFPGENTFLVTGHTPTPVIREDKQPLIYEANGHIAVDSGCVFGGRLAAYCLETGEVTYVDSKQKKRNKQ